MKKLLITVAASCLALASVTQAVAGPDFNAREQVRRTHDNRPQADVVARDQLDANAFACPTEKLALPLDHGPRAQTTQYANRLRFERYTVAMKACEDRGLKASK